jgi:hypothetical protein
MAAVRFSLAGLILLGWSIAREGRSFVPPTRREWRDSAIVGALLLGGGMGLVAFGEQTIPSGITALIIATMPVWVAIFGRIFLGELLPRVAVFSIALAVELAAGTAPPACGCLLGSRPPGPLSLVRNALLGLVAVGAALGLHPALGRAFWTVSYVALWAAVLVLAALVLALYRQVGVLHLRQGPGHAFEHEAEGLPLGEPAPDGTAGRLVVFTSPDCPICAQIVPGLRALAADHAIAVERVRYEDDRGRELYTQFLVPGTPYAVYVDAAGYVRAKGTINTLEQLEGLVVSGRVREREQLVGDRAA